MIVVTNGGRGRGRGFRVLGGRLLLILGSLLLGLGAAELLFRAQLEGPYEGNEDDAWYSRYRRMNQTIYRRSPDPDLVYEPVPGASVEMEYGPAAFNRGGLRESGDVPLAPGSDRRVAVVGDSLVWGEFLAVDDAPAQQIDRALGAGFEALNFGVTGYDMVQEAVYYERRVRPYHPAIVVVVFCMNDFLIMSGPFERFANGRDRARKDAQEGWMERVADVRRETLEGVLERREREATFKILARALGIWERRRFEERYVDEYLVSFRDETRRDRTSSAIAELGRAIHADGARGLFVISPVLESWENYHWGEIHAHVAEIAEAAGFTVVDPYRAWHRAEDPSSMRVDNIHYSENGSRLLGEAMASAVRDLDTSPDYGSRPRGP